MAGANDPIAERIREILAERQWTPAELNRRAGFTSPTHVSTLLNRGAASTRGPTLARIAAAAGVRLEWLTTGRGPRDVDEHAEGDDPKMRHRAGYQGALAVARTLRPQYGDYVWQAVGDSDPLLVAPVTPGLLAKVADLLVEFIPPPEPRRGGKADGT